MSLNSVLAFLAALFSAALALVVMLRKPRSVAGCCFSAGVVAFAIEAVFQGLSFTAATPESVGFWQGLALIVRAFLPGLWLCFSLTYSRGNYREFLARSRLVLVVAFLFPLALLPALRMPLI